MKLTSSLRVAAGLALAGSSFALVPAAHAADKIVNPAPPAFMDACGTSSDTYTIPATQGVSYYVEGVKLNAGVRVVNPVKSFVEVFTVADSGYKLSQAATWQHQFDTRSGEGGTGCVTKPKQTSANTTAPSPSNYTANVGGTQTAPPPSSGSSGQTGTASPSASPTELPYTGFDPMGMSLAAGGVGIAGLMLLGGVGVAAKRSRR